MRKISQIPLYILTIYPLLAFITLYFFNAAIDNVSAAVFLLFMLIILGDKLLYRRTIALPPYLIFFIFFSIYVFIVDFYPHHGSLKAALSKIHLWEYSKTIIICFIIENIIVDVKFIRHCHSILITTLIAAMVVMIFQFFEPTFFQSPLVIEFYKGDLSEYRDSIFSWISANALSLSLVPIFSLVYGLNNYLKKNNLITIITGLFSTFFSGARSTMVALFVNLIFQTTFETKRKFSKITWLILVAGLLAFSLNLVLGLMGFDLQSFIQNRILSDSASTRLLAWEMFLKFFPENFLFGTGGIKQADLIRELAGRSSQIHVGFLSLFYYYGIFGGVIFFVFLFTLLKKIKRTAVKSGFWGSYFSIISFIIANFTLVYLHIYEYGLLLALAYNRFFEEKNRYAQKEKLTIVNDT